MSEHTYTSMLIRYDGRLARLLSYVRPRSLARWLMRKADLPVVGECWVRHGNGPWQTVHFDVNPEGVSGPRCPECGDVPARFRAGWPTQRS